MLKPENKCASRARQFKTLSHLGYHVYCKLHPARQVEMDTLIYTRVFGCHVRSKVANATLAHQSIVCFKQQEPFRVWILEWSLAQPWAN
jgi:hypothetical protein